MFQSEEKFTTIEETQEIVKNTIDSVFNVVCSTLGPDGNVVVIQQGTAVKTTKDGATVARSLEFSNFHQDKINQIIAEAARKTELECGDGTTTTIFLTKLYYDLFRKYPGFVNRQYIERMTNQIIEVLRQRTITLQPGDERLRQVAMITANQDKSIVDTVMSIYKEYGNPIIELKEGVELADRIAKQNGQPIRMSMADAAFSAHGNGSATEFKGLMYVVVNANFTDMRSDYIKMLADALEPISMKHPEATIGLVVNQAATAFTGAVMALNNHIKSKNMKSRYVVFSTNLGGKLGGLVMGDIATILNAPYVNSLDDIKNAELNVFEGTVVGTLEGSIIQDITEETTRRIAERVKDIQRSMDDMNMGDRYSTIGRATERRMNELTGQIVTVFVGGETSSDIKERKDRFEDVGLAIRSALDNGILPGCGIALREAAIVAADTITEDVNFPRDIVVDIVRLCFQQWKHLTKSGLVDTAAGMREASENRIIKNLATGEEGTPEELGVYDTAYASITALKGGMTTAKILANTSSIILGNRSGAIPFNNK